jgi:hypothetical protein
VVVVVAGQVDRGFLLKHSQRSGQFFKMNLPSGKHTLKKNIGLLTRRLTSHQGSKFNPRGELYFKTKITQADIFSHDVSGDGKSFYCHNCRSEFLAIESFCKFSIPLVQK